MKGGEQAVDGSDSRVAESFTFEHRQAEQMSEQDPAAAADPGPGEENPAVAGRGLSVRLARPEEHPAVGELTVRAYVADGHNRPTDGYVAVLRDASTRAARGDLLVAVSADGRLVGTVTLAWHASELAHLAEEGEAELRMLATDPSTRGQGVGRALVEAAIGRAKQGGAHGVVLSTMPRMLAAQRLYHRLGFLHSPALDRTPLPGLTLLGYRLELGAAGTSKV